MSLVGPAVAMPTLETERLLLRPLALDDARHFGLLFDGDWDAVRQTGRMPYPPTERCDPAMDRRPSAAPRAMPFC